MVGQVSGGTSVYVSHQAVCADTPQDLLMSAGQGYGWEGLLGTVRGMNWGYNLVDT